MPDSEPHAYVELRLQTEAVRWLSDQWGYVEHLSDVQATGDRVDSVGTMDGRLVLIEVKPTVHAGLVRHASDRPGTIESKIAGALKGLYEGSIDRLSMTARTLWDPVRPPIIGLLAGQYSGAALTQLEDLLRRRAAAWCFDYRVWRWTGDAAAELAAADLRPPPSPDAYGKVAIERLIGRSTRGKPRTIDELLALAADRGVGDLFALAIDAATTLGNPAAEHPV